MRPATFAAWFEARVVIDPTCFTTAKALYDDYAAEMRAAGVPPMWRVAFAHALTDRNVERARLRDFYPSTGVALYCGVRLAEAVASSTAPDARLPWPVEPGLYADTAGYALALASLGMAMAAVFWRDALFLSGGLYGGAITYFWIALERRDLLRRTAEAPSQSLTNDRCEADQQKNGAHDAE